MIEFQLVGTDRKASVLTSKIVGVEWQSVRTSTLYVEGGHKFLLAESYDEARDRILAATAPKRF